MRCAQVGKVPRGPKDQKNSRFRSGLKISSENEIFERATHRGPIFCGEIETSRLKFSSEIKISIEIKNFDRDQFFLIVGPSGSRWGLSKWGLQAIVHERLSSFCDETSP